MDETYEQTVTVSADQSACSIEVINHYNLAPVMLQKQMHNGIEYVDVDRFSYGEFQNCFAIEQKNDDGSWTEVADQEQLSLSQAGQILAVLPVYDDAGQAIVYRFRETLPMGWHDPQNASAGEMYSAAFDLVDVLGKPTGKAKQIIMQNGRNGQPCADQAVLPHEQQRPVRSAAGTGNHLYPVSKDARWNGRKGE